MDNADILIVISLEFSVYLLEFLIINADIRITYNEAISLDSLKARLIMRNFIADILINVLQIF